MACDPETREGGEELSKTYANLKPKPVMVDLNPKAVTNNELFGIINPATRQWKDGKLMIRKPEKGGGAKQDIC